MVNTEPSVPIPGDDESNQPIQVVVRYTGLSPDLIRAWEKRYRAVEPARARNGRRLYSSTDIRRLSMLRQVTQFGRRISEVAHLSNKELEEMAKQDEAAVARRPDHREDRLSTGSVMEFFDRCSEAVTQLDARLLHSTLDSAAEELGAVFLLEDLVAPLLHHIEEECREGELLSCHRRLFTEVVHGRLMALSLRNRAAQNDFVVCSMANDPQLTALRTAVLANHYGWNPIYLGEHVSCNEAHDAAISSQAKAAVISFDETSEDTNVPNEMRRLASSLPKSVQLIINAPDACTYSSVLNETEALHVHSLGDLRLELERLAKKEPPTPAFLSKPTRTPQ